MAKRARLAQDHRCRKRLRRCPRRRRMSLADAAKKVGAEAVHVAAVDSKGLAPDGAKANVPARARTFLQQALHRRSRRGRRPVPDRRPAFYAIKVIGITPPAVKPLAQVRDRWSRNGRRPTRETVLRAHQGAHRAGAEGRQPCQCRQGAWPPSPDQQRVEARYARTTCFRPSSGADCSACRRAPSLPGRLARERAL